MGATQLLQRQSDPIADSLQQAGDSIASTLQKQQSLKLTGQYYKILAKNAQTEQDKFKFDRLAKLNSDILPQIAATTDPATKAMLIKGVTDSDMYGGDTNTFFKDIAESHKQTADHHENVTGSSYDPGQLSQMQPSQGIATQGQLAGAQMNEANAMARINAAKAKAYENPQAYMQSMMQGLNNSPTGASADSAQPSNGLFNNAPTWNSQTIEGALGSTTFGNPQGEYNKAAATSAAGEMVKKQFSLAPVKERIGIFRDSLNKAINEIGGPSSTEMEAGGKAILGRAVAGAKLGSNIPAYEASKASLANQITTDINGGRGNLTEIQGVMKAFPSIEHSTTTNRILNKGLDAMTAIPGMGTGKVADQDAQGALQLVQRNAKIATQDDAFVKAQKARGVDQATIEKKLQALHQMQGY